MVTQNHYNPQGRGVSFTSERPLVLYRHMVQSLMHDPFQKPLVLIESCTTKVVLSHVPSVTRDFKTFFANMFSTKKKPMFIHV